MQSNLVSMLLNLSRKKNIFELKLLETAFDLNFQNLFIIIKSHRMARNFLDQRMFYISGHFQLYSNFNQC